MSSFVIILLILFFTFVLPSLRKKGHKASFGRKKSSTARSPHDYGNVTLDGRLISQRNKGVLDPSAMYSDTKRAKELPEK